MFVQLKQALQQASYRCKQMASSGGKVSRLLSVDYEVFGKVQGIVQKKFAS